MIEFIHVVINIQIYCGLQDHRKHNCIVCLTEFLLKFSLHTWAFQRNLKGQSSWKGSRALEVCFILKERLNALAIRFNNKANVLFLGFPDGSVVKNWIPCQCRVRKIPWWRKWQPTPVFLPGKSHGQRNLAVYSPSGHKRVVHNLATKQQWQLCFFVFFMIHTFFLHFFVGILSVCMCVCVPLGMCLCALLSWLAYKLLEGNT